MYAKPMKQGSWCMFKTIQFLLGRLTCWEYWGSIKPGVDSCTPPLVGSNGEMTF